MEVMLVIYVVQRVTKRKVSSIPSTHVYLLHSTLRDI